MCYCQQPPWPNLKLRLDVLLQFLMRQKISNSNRIISNRKKTQNQFQRKALIELNNSCRTNSLHIEMIDERPIGPVGKNYAEISNAFAQAKEYGFLALQSFEHKVSLST